MICGNLSFPILVKIGSKRGSCDFFYYEWDTMSERVILHKNLLTIDVRISIAII